MMKKNYTNKVNKLKNFALSALIIGVVAAGMSFGPMFMGPGLTVVEPFDINVNTTFPDDGVGAPAFTPAFPNLQFDSPITFTPVPNDNSRIVVGQLNGQIYSIGSDNATVVKQQIVDWSNEVGDINEGAVWDGGFLGLAIHPDFGVDPAKNFVFVYYTTSATNNTLGNSQGFSCGQENFSNNYLLLERFEVNPATMAFVAGSREIMMRRELYNTTHRGGGLTFGQDGFLYLTTGDQASYSPAQDIANNLDGGVLRLDVDMTGGAVSHAPKRFMQDAGVGNTHPNTQNLEMSGAFYFIPNDNPFNVPIGNPTSPVFEEYYTIGHRSPHRLTMDTATGDLYIGEVGESTHEEINVLRNNASTPGNNYGWPLWEGNAQFAGNCGLTQLYNNNPHEGPLTDFVRSEAGSIIGGYVYNGTIQQYQGRYIAADYVTNQMFAIDTQSGTKENLGVGPGQVISFGQDNGGELYMLTLGAGGDSGIFRLTASINTNAAPTLLSDTGAFVTDVDGDFSDIQELTVTSGFVPYEMIDPFWSDGAFKRRWMAVPNDGSHNTADEQIDWSENGVWNFPEGSVIIKHFDFPLDDSATPATRKIETRFSIKADNGAFYYLTYKWNAAETDATLIDMTAGDTADINVTRNGAPETVTWEYPSNAQCIQCHSPALGGTLGPRTRFLNSDYDYSDYDPANGSVGNQLVTLSALGILNATITDNDTPNYLTHVSIDDPNGSLEERARSYLDNNCAYCHQPATGIGSEIDLRRTNTLAQTKMLTAIGNNIPGEPTISRIVLPGDAANSQLYHRANSLIPGVKMPPVSKGIVDEQGVALLQSWINQLQPAAAVPALGTYRLVNFDTKGTLGIEDGVDALGGNAEEQGYQALGHQHWVMENATTADYYRFTPEFSPRYLDVNGRPADADFQENVWQWNSDPNTFAQQWEVVPDDLIGGIQTYFIISRVNGNYLTIQPNGNVAVLDYDINDIDRFRWQFETPSAAPIAFGLEFSKTTVVTNESASSDTFDVSLSAAPSSDVVLDLTPAGAVDEYTVSTASLTFTTTNWATPQTVTVTGEDDSDDDCVQYYTIDVRVNAAASDADYAGFFETIEGYNEDNDGSLACPPAGGVYRLVNVGNNQSMEVAAAGLAWRDNIETGLYEGATHEQFELVFRGDGLYALVAEHSGLAVDVQGGVNTPNTNIWQYDYAENTNNLAQLWTVVGDGTGQFSIISEVGGHFLGVASGTNNVYVNVDDGSDRYKWRFEDISQLSNAGVNITPELVYTDEDGDTDSFDVVLNSAPTGDVNVAINILTAADEISLDVTQLVFTTVNWNTPQTVTVTGLDDLDADGVQEFEIEATVVAPFNDATYIAGVGASVSGFNYDNDGGNNGAPRPGIYQLRNSGNGENLMPVAGANVWQTNMVTGDYLNEAYQHFELVPAINGLFRIKLLVADPVRGDLYLDKQGGPGSTNPNIWTYPSLTPDPNFAQLWDIVEAGDGSYYIISAIANTNFTNNTYLRAEDVSGTEGNVSIATDDSSDFFKWQFLGTGFPPEAIATLDVSDGNEDLAVQFTGSASTDDKNDIVSYLWDFGNGDTANTADPLYTYTEGGTFIATLTVTDGDGFTDESDPLTITVNGGPVALASADVLTGVAPLEVNFTGDQSTDDVGIDSFSWSFGDSGNSTDANPTHTFIAEGTYEVELIVTDEGGLQDTTTVTIVVTANQAPVAVATADIVTGEAALEVNFTGNQSTDDVGIVSYEWNFADGGNSTEPNPTYTFDIGGDYDVVLTVTDAGGLVGTQTVTISVTVPNGAPVAVAEADVTEGEAPLEVNFTGDQSLDDSGIVTYEWTFDDGGTSSEANPQHSFILAGTYDVVLRVTDGDGLIDEDTVTIIVTETNEAPAAVATSNVSEGEAPLEVSFTGDQSTDDAAIVSYAWDFGDGSSSTEANPTHTFTGVDVYTVILTVMDAEGLMDTESLTITVTETMGNVAPVAVVSSDVLAGVAPLEVSFTGDQSTDDEAIVSYAWDFGDGSSSTEANPTHTFTGVDVYTVILTVMDAEGLMDTESLTITVTETMGGIAPIAVVSSNLLEGEAPLEVTFSGDQSTVDGDFISYAWDFGDGTDAAEANPTHTFTADGTYTVVLTVTDANGITDTASIEIVVVSENEPTDVVSFEFILTPNPSTEAVQIVMSDNFDTDEILGVMIHDTSGRLIRQFTRDEFVQRSMIIPTNIYRNELYVVTVMFRNNDPVSKRLLINN